MPEILNLEAIRMFSPIFWKADELSPKSWETCELSPKYWNFSPKIHVIVLTVSHRSQHSNPNLFQTELNWTEELTWTEAPS